MQYGPSMPQGLLQPSMHTHAAMLPSCIRQGLAESGRACMHSCACSGQAHLQRLRVVRQYCAFGHCVQLMLLIPDHNQVAQLPMPALQVVCEGLGVKKKGMALANVCR